MQNIIIFKNREIYRRNSDILGIWGENNYETLCFGFYDDFIDGDAILEFEFPDGQKKFIELEKDIEEKFYKILIKSSLLQQEGDIKLELKIINENEIIYKTKIFIMKVLEAINATATFEDDYPDFVTTTTAKLEELENNKQDKLTAGENITIKDGVISATGGISTEETDPTVPQHVKDITEEDISTWNNKSDFSGNYEDLENKPEIPTKTSELENDSGYIAGFTETDPTVPSWAKAPNKPTYTAEEVGALPDSTELFSGNYDDLKNKPIIPDVSNFITNTVDNLINYYKKAETYTQEEINQLISQIPKFSIQPVDELPTENISNSTVYLLKTSETETGNLYTEYIYVNNNWEELGTQRLDLTGYATKEYVNTELSKKEEVIIGTEEPTGDTWKLFIDLDEPEEEYITKDVTNLTNYYDKTYIDEQIGNIETLLSEV